MRDDAPSPSTQNSASCAPADLREWWLHRASTFLQAHLSASGIACPDLRVSCGWPAKGGLNTRTRVIGQCFAGQICADGKPQIFISPLVADSVDVLGILLHEMVHAAIGCEHGHKKPFSQAARRVGLAGRPTATTVGAALRPLLEAYVQREGVYPHAPIRLDGPRTRPAEEEEGSSDKPGSRLRLYECACAPPVKIRVASDDFQGQCMLCHEQFHRVSKRPTGA